MSDPGPPLSIKLLYEGTDVDGGTMPIEEVVSALQGFAGAYGKVADHLIPSSAHELRVSSIDKGSFELAILAWVFSGQGHEAIETIKSVGSAARYVFSIVGKVISAKKHIRGRPYQASVEGSNNTTVVINADNVKMELPREVLELLESKLVDPDLAKIASPLHAEAISKAQLTASDRDGSLEADISSSDKVYFSPQDAEETKQETEITGILVSLNKETLRGTFKRSDGFKVPYRYVGDHPESFYSNFSQKGALRVSCTAYFDENLALNRLEIKEVIRLQSELPLSTDSKMLPAPQ